MIHEYKTARSICGFVEFIAWAGVVIAAILVIMAIGTASSARGGSFALVALLPALWLALGSFLIIIIVQMTRATMDGSVAAQKNVIQGQKQHEELMRSLKDLAGRPTGFSQSEPHRATQHKETSETPDSKDRGQLAARIPTSENQPATETMRHNGMSITVMNGEYRVFGIPHKTLDEAKAYIDGLDDQSTGAGSDRREPTLAAPKGQS